jgi:hypothetical protein
MSADEIPVSDTPTPLEEAERTLERIAWHKKNLDHHRRLAAQREAEIRERIAYHEAILKSCAWQLKQEYGTAETPLPGGGRVRIAKARGDFVIEDETVAAAYAKSVDCLRSRIVESIDKVTLRGKLKDTEQGLVDPLTGELVTWAKIDRPTDGMSLSYTLPGATLTDTLRAAIRGVTGKEAEE